MTNPYEQGSLRYNIREKTTDLKEAVVEPVKKGWELIPEENRQSISKSAGEFAQNFGTAWEGTKRIDNKYDPTEYAAAGTAYALEGIGTGFDWLTNQVAQKTGIDPAVVAVGEMFVPWSKLGQLSKVSKLKKLQNVQKLNNISDISFLNKVEKVTGQTNLQTQAASFLNQIDNVDGIFKDSTLDTIKNIQKQYPITPKNPKVITPKEAKLRNQAMFKEGINVYKDELNMTWKRLGEGRWRNTTARNATRQKIDQITGLPGTRRNSTINYINKRSRDLVASNADEVKHVNSIYSSRDAVNQRLKLVKGDRNFMTVEHRISQSDWKKLGLEGNPHDSANLWLTTTYEATVKTTIENTLRKKAIKGNYIVDFNPQNNALHVMKLENFKLNELPTGKRFKKNAKGDYNLQAIEKYLTTLE